jgi:hypothetical protein
MISLPASLNLVSVFSLSLHRATAGILGEVGHEGPDCANPMPARRPDPRASCLACGFGTHYCGTIRALGGHIALPATPTLTGSVRGSFGSSGGET